MSSFSIKSFYDIEKQIDIITTQLNIVIPNVDVVTTIGFKINNPIILLQKRISFLQNELIKNYGYILPPIVDGFEIKNQLNTLNKSVLDMLNYTSNMLNLNEFKFTIYIASPEIFEIKVSPNYDIYDYNIDWGDNTVEEKNQINSIDHMYENPGTYTLRISGTFPTIDLLNNTQITCIHQFGLLGWETLENSFRGCTNLTSVISTYGANDVINVSYAWYNCTNLKTFNSTFLTRVKKVSSAWAKCTSLIAFDATFLTNVTSSDNGWSECSSMTTFNASGLTSMKYCAEVWRGCSSLTTFNTSSLTEVVECSDSWKDCTGLKTFDASGLGSNVLDCNNAWFNTTIWVLGNTFTNYDKVKSAYGWDQGTLVTNSPRTNV